jgi:hypothetical protein
VVVASAGLRQKADHGALPSLVVALAHGDRGLLQALGEPKLLGADGLVDVVLVFLLRHLPQVLHADRDAGQAEWALVVQDLIEDRVQPRGLGRVPDVGRAPRALVEVVEGPRRVMPRVAVRQVPHGVAERDEVHVVLGPTGLTDRLPHTRQGFVDHHGLVFGENA